MYHRFKSFREVNVTNINWSPIIKRGMSVRMITKINRLTVVIKPSGPPALFGFSLRRSVFTLAIVNLGSNDNVGNGGGQLGMTLLSI